jgi:hypothetical protein
MALCCLIPRLSAFCAQPLAMQNVEGSNPFSRFLRKPRFGGVFCVEGRDGRPSRRPGLSTLRPFAPDRVIGQAFPYVRARRKFWVTMRAQRTRCGFFRGVAFMVVLVALLLAPNSAFASHVWFGRSVYRLSATASNGYTFRLSTFRNRLYHRISLIAEDGEGQYVRYSVKGLPSHGRLRAAFPGVGAIDVALRPEGARSLPPPEGCKRPNATIRYGAFVGKIKLRGERGFTKLETSEVHGTIETGQRQRCGSPTAQPTRDPLAKRGRGGPRSDYELRLTTGHVTVNGTERVGSTEGSFYAVSHERRGGMEIERHSPTVSSPGDFQTNAELTDASFLPPPPFRGRATFSRPSFAANCSQPCPSPIGEIAGNLRVPLPGLGTVQLTGSEISASLREWTPHF